MKDLISINKKLWMEKRKYFENLDLYLKKIKNLAQNILGSDTKVYLFGSVLKGDWTPQSDIDILIVSSNLSQNWEENRWIRTKIKSEIDPFSPFQIHLVTPTEFENWYRNFVKERLEVY